MHILLDEKTNNIIILEFQKIKGSKTSLHQSPGQGLQVSLIHVLFKPHKLRKFAKMSWGLLCQAHEKENGYHFSFFPDPVQVSTEPAGSPESYGALAGTHYAGWISSGMLPRVF